MLLRNGIRPVFIPVPQEKCAVALLVSFKSKNSKIFAECLQELFPIASLDTSSSLARGVSGFPGGDFCGNFHLLNRGEAGLGAALEQPLHPVRTQPPFRDETVRRQAAMQRRSCHPVLIDIVAARNGAQATDVEERIL